MPKRTGGLPGNLLSKVRRYFTDCRLLQQGQAAVEFTLAFIFLLIVIRFASQCADCSDPERDLSFTDGHRVGFRQLQLFLLQGIPALWPKCPEHNQHGSFDYDEMGTSILLMTRVKKW